MHNWQFMPSAWHRRNDIICYAHWSIQAQINAKTISYQSHYQFSLYSHLFLWRDCHYVWLRIWDIVIYCLKAAVSVKAADWLFEFLTIFIRSHAKPFAKLTREKSRRTELKAFGNHVYQFICSTQLSTSRRKTAISQILIYGHTEFMRKNSFNRTSRTAEITGNIWNMDWFFRQIVKWRCNTASGRKIFKKRASIVTILW